MTKYLFIIRNNLLFILLFTILSCSKQKNEQILYYSISRDSVPHMYHAVVISQKDKMRKIKKYEYYINDSSIVNKSVEYYQIVENSLIKYWNYEEHKGDDFFSLVRDSCIEFKLPDVYNADFLRTIHCYIGDTVIAINGEQVKAHYFEKNTGFQYGIRTNIFYDNDFHLLKEEYVDGYIDSFVIKQVNYVPQRFLFLLKQSNIQTER